VDKECPNGNASLCVRCGKCVEHCPQGIAIPDELKKVHAILGRRQWIDRHDACSLI
jgi:predicted aldo/keto reductase-like oxidoreductase